MTALTFESKKESEIITDPLNQETLKSKLHLWNSLLSTCFGPFGKTVAIQNVIGGCTNITKSSARLFELVRSSDPFIKLVISVIKNHLKRFNDFGKFTMLFILETLSCFENVELQPSVKATSVDYIADIIKKHLSKDDCCCKSTVDFSNISQVLNILKFIFNSKLAVTLSDTELKFISSLLLEAFLLSIPNTKSTSDLLKLGHLHVIQQEGLPLKNSKIYSGFLHSVLSSRRILTGNIKQPSKIALFNVSLAGDSLHNFISIETKEVSMVEDAVLLQLFQIGEKLLKFGINILACQKVVHPKLSKFLQNQGIIILERLGENGCKILKDLTGCVPIGSLSAELSYENCFGVVDKVEIISVFNKQFAYISGSAATVILCNSDEEALTELNLVFWQGYHSLLTLMKNPIVYIGGGCLEIHLCNVINYQISKDLNEENVFHLGLSRGQLSIVSRTFESILSNLTFKLRRDDKLSYDKQRWSCGACKTQNEKPLSLILDNDHIFDIGASKLSAYSTSLEIITLLLRVGVCIIDKN